MYIPTRAGPFGLVLIVLTFRRALRLLFMDIFPPSIPPDPTYHLYALFSFLNFVTISLALRFVSVLILLLVLLLPFL